MSKKNYQERVFEVTRLIPVGKISTYGAIADYLELGSARMAVSYTHLTLPTICSV